MASLRSRKPMKFGLQHRQQLASNSVLKADLAYGDYPYVEKIPEKRLANFPPNGTHQIKMAKCKP